MTEEKRDLDARLEFEKATAALAAARTLLAHALWDDAVSRAYYAAFHAVTALLFSAGLQARTHTHAGVHDLLFLHFVRPGTLPRQVIRDFAALQRYREQADYSTATRFDAETAAEEVERAARIIEPIEALLRQHISLG